MASVKFSDLSSRDVYFKAADQFLNAYMTPAFGALPKGEIDLLVLQFLESVGYVDPDASTYDLISKLKVTRSKSRKLIYERELRRSSISERV